METDRICPNCRKVLPPDVPLGLCPECLIKAGFPTGTEPGSSGMGRFVPPPVAEIAKLFPQFEILSLIGKGGMGAVYKARQPGLDRFVALKVLPPAVANDPGFAERFNREARALARLSHPNIVVVYDYGTAGTLNYLVMEFVDGTNLREVEQAGKLSSEQALAIVPQICEALQFAHNEGIVHRDIKPENLLIDKKGRVKITDFGIAKILDVPTGKVALTGAKDVVGTPHYMAPEQIEKPQTVDHRADIYSLGVVFYEMLTGELPLGKFSPPSKKVQVDVRLDEVVLHTLEKEPERRYQQVSQVKTDIETIAGTPPAMGAAATAGTAPPVFHAPPQEATSDKILLPTFLLAFFFGIFGAHRFYVGKIGTAIAQLFTLGGLGVWSTIDWILILCKVFTDGNGRRITNWWHPGPPKPPGPSKSPAPPIAPLPDGSHTIIIAPAVALLVAGCMKLFGASLALLFLQFGWGVRPLTSTLGHIGFPVWGIYTSFSTILFSVIPAVVIIYGAVEMMRIRNHCWAIAAAIVAIVFCNLVGLPAGIWALIVLLQPRVRATFSNRGEPQAPETWPWILGVVAVICLLFVLMMSVLAFLFEPHAEPLAAQATAHVSRTHHPRMAPAPSAPWQPASPTPPTPPTPPVFPSNATNGQPPVLTISNSPAGATEATFTVIATGTQPLTYQWYKNGTNPVAIFAGVRVTNDVVVTTNASGTQPAELHDQTIDLGGSTDFSQSFTVEPGGQLMMDVDRGDVHITGGDQDTVEIRVEREVTHGNGTDPSVILKEEHVTLQQTGNTISITAQEPEMLRSKSLWGLLSRPNLNAHYEITIPHSFTVQSKTSGGDIRVAGVQGSVTITTMGGRLDCQDIGGNLDGKTMGGDVQAANCKGKSHLETMGGSITIDGFSGPNIQASTQGGSVSADFVAAPTADCKLSTSGGNVTARLPEAAAVTLDAHTEGGSVSSDFPVATGHGFVNQSLQGPINGGGPKLKMETMGGNIEVLKR